MNDFDLLPAPTEAVNDILSDVTSTDDENYEECIEEDDISALYEDWINQLDREDVLMMAMMTCEFLYKATEVYEVTCS